MSTADGSAVDALSACPDCGRLVRGTAQVGHGAEVIWLPVDLGSVAAARAHAAAVLVDRGVDPAHLDDAVLLVSELASDVVVGAGTGFFGVVVDVVDGRVAVDVRTLDAPATSSSEGRDGDALVTLPRRPHREEIVAALADEWGIARARRSTSAWFALVLPPRGPATD